MPNKTSPEWEIPANLGKNLSNLYKRRSSNSLKRKLHGLKKILGVFAKKGSVCALKFGSITFVYFPCSKYSWFRVFCKDEDGYLELPINYIKKNSDEGV